MNISATLNDRAETLRSIRDSVGALVPKAGNLQRIRSLRFTEMGFEPASLELMGKMGWISLTLPEDAGGMGLGLSELCAVCQELGAGLVPEPLIQANLSASLLALLALRTTSSPVNGL